MIFHNSGKLGDHLWAAMMLRRIGGSHGFFVRDEYMEELTPLIADTSHALKPRSQWRGNGINTWIGDTQYDNLGVKWRGQRDIIGFVMEYLNIAAIQASGARAFRDRVDMLWDAPAIIEAKAPKVELLFVNAVPESGQCPGFNGDEMDRLAREMGTQFSVANTTVGGRNPFSLVEIAAMSMHARVIVSVAAGPHWVTWNQWNRNTPRVILMHPEYVDFGTNGIVRHVSDVAQAREALLELT